jgi:hypothetical protein
MKEDVLDPVRRFMRGNKRKIYDQARAFIQEQGPNFSAWASDVPGRLQAILSDPQCYRGDQMRQAKELMDEAKASIQALVEDERQRAMEDISRMKEKMEALDDYNQVSLDQRAILDHHFESIEEKIQGERLIAVIRDSLRRFREEQYTQLLVQIDAWTQPDVAEPPAEYVNRARLSVSVPFTKAYLATEEDVEAYLAKLKAAMIKAIQDGKRIQL